jgi:hypothetical protein
VKDAFVDIPIVDVDISLMYNPAFLSTSSIPQSKRTYMTALDGIYASG